MEEDNLNNILNGQMSSRFRFWSSKMGITNTKFLYIMESDVSNISHRILASTTPSIPRKIKGRFCM